MADSMQQQREPSHSSFQITPLCLVLWIVAAIVVLGLQVSDRAGEWTSDNASEYIGYLLGMGMGLLGVPATIGWIVFHIFRRSQRGGSATFVIMLALCTIGAVNRLLEQRQASAAMDNLVQETKADLKRQIAEDNSPEKLLEVSSSHLDKVKQAAAEFKGNAATAAEIAIALGERVRAAGLEYVKLSKRLEAAEILNPATIKIQEQIDERRALLRKCLQANQEFRSLLLGSNAFVRRELSRRGVPEAVAKEFMTGFERSQARTLPLLLSIRDKEGELGAAMLEILDLWESQWGNWQFNSTRNAVEYQDPQTADRYNALMAQIRKAANEEAELQKQVAEQM